MQNNAITHKKSAYRDKNMLVKKYKTSEQKKKIKDISLV